MNAAANFSEHISVSKREAPEVALERAEAVDQVVVVSVASYKHKVNLNLAFFILASNCNSPPLTRSYNNKNRRTRWLR